MRSRYRRWAAGLVVVAAAPLVGPGVAHASLTGVFIHGVVITVPANSTSSVLLQCPDVRTSLSGGFQSHEFGQVPRVVVFASYPDGIGWRVKAHNYTTTAQTYLAETTCGVLTNRTVVEAPAALPTQGTGSVSATCPNGRVNVGGGFRSADFQAVSVRTNRPFTSGHGWLFTVQNTGTTINPEIASYAVCGTVGGRVLRDTSVQVAPRSSVAAEARCPDGKTSTAGGWVTNSNEGNSVDESVTGFEGHTVTFRNPSTTTTYTMVSRVVCVTES